MIWVIWALFVWLASQTLVPKGSSGSGSGAPTVTVQSAPAASGSLPFTVDGRRAGAGGAPLVLRQGQVVRFDAAAAPVRISRLECAHDVHRLRRTWRVPDLPKGEYALEGRGFGVGFHEPGHSAPCP
jgi:hypothetical protein